jgi:hypothetical protein
MDLTVPYTFYPIALPHWGEGSSSAIVLRRGMGASSRDGTVSPFGSSNVRQGSQAVFRA